MSALRLVWRRAVDRRRRPGERGAVAVTVAIIKYNFTFVTPIGFMAGFLGGGSSTVQLQSKSVMPCLH